MDLDRLKTFVDAAQTLNFSETARRLQISQPSVSKYIQALEKELSIELFDRNSGNLQLTEQARALLPWARQVLRDCQKLSDIANSLDEKISGTLRIVCTTASGRHILPQLAARFRWKFPDVMVNIQITSPSEALSQVRNNQADLAVFSFEIQEEGLERQYFFADEVILIAPAQHPWSKQGSIQPEDLIGEPLILRESSSGTYNAMIVGLAAHDIALDDLNVFLEIGNTDGIISAVASGLGVAFVSKSAAKCALNMQQVCSIPVSGVSLMRQIYLLRNSLRISSRPAELFWGFIHEIDNQDLYQA